MLKRKLPSDNNDTKKQLEIAPEYLFNNDALITVFRDLKTAEKGFSAFKSAKEAERMQLKLRSN